MFRGIIRKKGLGMNLVLGIGFLIFMGLQIGGLVSLGADSFYEISSIEDFNRMRSDLGGYFVLVRNVDLSGINFRPIGTEGEPFRGTLEGGGKVIVGLTVIQPNGDGVGLFGHIGKGGFVKNLRLEDVRVEGRKYVGGLVGRNEGSIRNSRVMGSITGIEYVGGMVGSNAGLAWDSVVGGRVYGLRRVGGFFWI